MQEKLKAGKQRNRKNQMSTSSIILIGIAGTVTLVAGGIFFWRWVSKRRRTENMPGQRRGDGGSESAGTLRKSLLTGIEKAEGQNREKLEGKVTVSPETVMEVADNENHAQPEKDSIEGCSVTLEAISGPSAGARVSRTALKPPWPILTVGRVSQNDLALNDPEVSSRHASVWWNANLARWQVVDKGSLNGTLLNDAAISLDQSEGGPRRDGEIHNLKNGDILTVGTSSQLLVRISGSLRPEKAKGEPPIPQVTPAPDAPFAVAVEAQPMTARKGGKTLPMEDVALCEWPLRGLKDFGVFCVFDGHSGSEAAINASRILPDRLSAILLSGNTFVEVQEECNAADVLREAIKQTEEELPNEYEGCTATVLLVWRDQFEMLVVQAANLGDSHCVLGFGSQQVILTEDHRLTGPVERARLSSIGKPLRDGETRLCGMNIARALGDKYMKQEDVGMSSEPYVSQAMPLGDGFDTVAVIASDGLWDVISPKRAIQIIMEAKEAKDNAHQIHGYRSGAVAAASSLIKRAKLAKTQDNTTVVVLDFGMKPK